MTSAYRERARNGDRKRIGQYAESRVGLSRLRWTACRAAKARRPAPSLRQGRQPDAEVLLLLGMRQGQLLFDDESVHSHWTSPGVSDGEHVLPRVEVTRLKHELLSHSPSGGGEIDGHRSRRAVDLNLDTASP